MTVRLESYFDENLDLAATDGWWRQDFAITTNDVELVAAADWVWSVEIRPSDFARR